jgi:hypothetical protein
MRNPLFLQGNMLVKGLDICAMFCHCSQPVAMSLRTNLTTPACLFIKTAIPCGLCGFRWRRRNGLGLLFD